jgi:hypothetical protein
VAVALMGDQRMFSHPRVGLAQVDAGLPGQLDQPLSMAPRFSSEVAPQYSPVWRVGDQPCG